jgi:pimeloyl-ACP methyl ester carboxylesterase
LGDFKPSFADFAEVLENFAIERGLEEAPMLGHSMGGVLLLIAAARGRIRPQQIINLDGSLPAREKTLAGLAVIRSWLDEADFRGCLAGALRNGFFLPQEQGEQCEEIIRTMSSAPESVLRFLPEQAGDLQAKEILPLVDLPVLYVATASPRFDEDEARRLLRDFQMESIPESGHFLQIYAAKKVAALTEKFLCSAA